MSAKSTPIELAERATRIAWDDAMPSRERAKALVDVYAQFGWPSFVVRVEQYIAAHTKAIPFRSEAMQRAEEDRIAEFMADLHTSARPPEVGEGVTVFGYSDSYPATIISVSKSGKKLTFRMDQAKLLNGPNSGEADALRFSPGGFMGHTSGEQRWEIWPDANGEEVTATLRADGAWRIVGGQRRIGVGYRFKHYDFNF